jgi:hypothetical protein
MLRRCGLHLWDAGVKGVKNRTSLLLAGITGTLLFAITTATLGIYPGLITVAWPILLLAITNYDRLMLLSSSFFAIFRKAIFWAERNTISTSLQGTINICAGAINEETPGLLPHRMKVNWVQPMNRDAFLKNDQVIVCLEGSENQSRNLARATILYVADDLLRESRRFVYPSLMKSTDFVVSRKILASAGNIAALNCLNEEFIQPAVQGNAELEAMIASLQRADSAGLLTRVMLRTFRDLSALVPPSAANPTAENETMNFFEIIERLGTKAKGVDVNPTLDGEIIRVAIMLVARAEAAGSTDPYVNFAFRCRQDNVAVLYVVARGQANCTLTEWVVDDVVKRDYYKRESCSKYPVVGKKGRKVDALVARLTISSVHTFKAPSASS